MNWSGMFLFATICTPSLGSVEILIQGVVETFSPRAKQQEPKVIYLRLILKSDVLMYEGYCIFIFTLQYMGIDPMIYYFIDSLDHIETIEEHYAQSLLPSMFLLQGYLIL